jgi:hypothetical protein
MIVVDCILLKYVKHGSRTLSRAQKIQSEAENLLAGNGHDVHILERSDL